MSIDKLFFVDMLSNGIPVMEDIDLATVFKMVEDRAEEAGYEIVVLENNLGILDAEGNIRTSLQLVENTKGDWRLAFFTPTEQEELLKIAKSVGAVLFVTVAICAQMNFLNTKMLPNPDLIGKPTGKEETEEFESDFI